MLFVLFAGFQLIHLSSDFHIEFVVIISDYRIDYLLIITFVHDEDIIHSKIITYVSSQFQGDEHGHLIWSDFEYTFPQLSVPTQINYG